MYRCPGVGRHSRASHLGSPAFAASLETNHFPRTRIRVACRRPASPSKLCAAANIDDPPCWSWSTCARRRFPHWDSAGFFPLVTRNLPRAKPSRPSEDTARPGSWVQLLCPSRRPCMMLPERRHRSACCGIWPLEPGQGLPRVDAVDLVVQGSDPMGVPVGQTLNPFTMGSFPLAGLPD
ncbi:hypothetical protein LZ30DRAFT_47994 [Colletotrichum cereale]|nr:hypothetical protein LZ30DRAFT_47994 [Colletotrichum cereale]